MHAVDRPGRHRLSIAYIIFLLPHVGGLSGCWNTSMEPDRKLADIYYSPRGYWKGLAAIKKLASAAKVTEQQAKDWLKKQAIWQIYLPAPRHIPRPKFDVAVPNEVHQADLLFLPHDRVRRKTFRYALTVVDVASRYKEAEPLTSKTAAEVADGLARIYKRSPLRWPKLLQVDPGREFMGSVSQLLAKHSVQVRRGRVDIHRDQGIVERFNRTLAERLFGHQYAQEMRLPSGERSTEWAKRLPSVVAALNGEVTRLTGKKPSDAIKAKILTQKPSSVVPGRPLGLKEQKVPSGVGVRYLYQPGELEGGRRRATDPVWSLEVYRLGRSVTKPDEPVLYYLQGDDAPQRGFVREELLAVPSDTQLPPDGVLRR
ncbi:MAG: DDE-type integrase/transposase/recombinase [Candidatus Thiodiazotropha sp.]